MVVCICNNINDSKLKECARKNICKISDVQSDLGCRIKCGKCVCDMQKILEKNILKHQNDSASDG